MTTYEIWSNVSGRRVFMADYKLGDTMGSRGAPCADFTDASEVVVDVPKEVKRFHVAVRGHFHRRRPTAREIGA